MAAYFDKHIATIEGDVSKWTVTFEQYLDTDPGSAVVEVERSLRLSYGDPDDWSSQEEDLLFSYLDLFVLDNIAGDFRTTLEALASDQDLKVSIVDEAGLYSWSGYISRASIIAPYYPGIVAPRFRVRAYCGLALLSREPNTIVATDLSIHDLTNRAVYDRAQPLDVTYILSWLPENNRIKTTGPGSVVQVVDTRFRYTNIDLSDFDTFATMLQDYDARVFQSILDNRWHVRQRLTDGQAITAASGFFNESIGGAPATDPGTAIALDTLTLTDDDVLASAGAPSRERVRSEIIITKAGKNTTSAIDLVKDPGLEEWIIDTPIYGKATGNISKETTKTHAGLSSMRIGSGPDHDENYRIDLLWVTKDEDLRLDGEFRARVDDVVPGDVDFQVKITPFKASDSIQYLLSAGTWTTTDTWITATGVDDATFDLITWLSTADPPIDGLVSITFGSVSGLDWFVDEVKVEIEDSAAVLLKEYKSTFSREADAGGVASGKEMTHTRNYYSHLQTGTSFFQTNDGAAQEPVSGWLNEAGVYFPFLSAEGAQARLARTGLFPRILVGTILDNLVPPGRSFTLNGETFRVMSGCRLDLVTNGTSGVFIKKYREI